MLPFTIYAHRGGLAYGPENALSTIKHSLALGVKAIEIDLWRVGDELFVTHDRRLGRTIPGEGRLLDHCPESLREKQLNCGETIATLRDVLSLVTDQIEINLELKGPNIVSLLQKQLSEWVSSQQGCNEQLLVSSFDHHQLFELQTSSPKIRRGVLISSIPLDYAHCAEALQAYSIHPSINFIAPGLIEDAHRRGIKVLTYTVNSPDDVIHMLEMGVDGIFSDNPLEAMQIRDQFLTRPIL